MLAMIHRNSSRGDTIVEVMLAIAVIAAVLGSTFVVMNRSFKNIRQAQERSEAVKMLEGQLERLKVSLKDAASAVPSTPSTKFCFSKVTGNVSIEGVTPSYAADCQEFGTVPGYYRLNIELDGLDPNLYTATAEWDSIANNGLDRASLKYKVYR